MKSIKKWLSLTLATLTLLSAATLFAGCGETTDNPDPQGTDAVTAASSDETGEVDHRFDGVNYKDREFRIYTSANSAEISTSNPLIEGIGKTGGGLVSDAVFARNVTVEELLGVKLVFTQCDLTYNGVAADIRKLTQSGDNDYELVINDIYGYSELIIEGNFRNVLDEDCVFDFDRNYWYKDYMEDLRLMDGYQYILAGDFFIDVIRTAKMLLVNKQIYQDHYGRPADELYDVVSNYEWTYDKLNQLITNIYIDKNMDGIKNAGDQFGYADMGFWPSAMIFAVSGTDNFITRDEDGIPSITIHEGDRANQLSAAITTLFNNESSSIGLTNGLLEPFVENQMLVMGGLSLGALESELLRQMEGDAAVLPYPMLYASDQKYITSVHDTTEMGAILTTASDMEFISTVVEVLNRETANILIPKYYKESLQVQCVDDVKSAAMIDIIHDNFDNSFILAYNNALSEGAVLHAFATAAEEKREFSAVFASSKKNINKILERKIQQFERNNTLG